MPMPPLSPTLRKAAVLISALDDRTADVLLEQMGPQQAALVRSALVALDDVPPAEQQAVLADFLRQQRRPDPAAGADDVSLELNAAAESVGGDVGSSAAVKDSAAPLAFLRDVAPQHLARILRTEQSQAIAVVIANLSAQHAADVLELLPSAAATDALSRMAWLDELTPEVAADLARSLREQLGPFGATSAAHRESLAHHSAVVAALHSRQR